MTQNQYKNPLLYLDTMVDAIEHMLRYAKGKDFADYEKDSQLSDAIHMRLQVLGESASKLDIDFRDEHPHIAWSEIRALRNVIAHDYASVKPERVWSTIQRDLPDLLGQIRQLIQRLEKV